ncbi:MAG: hypothetical protein OER97_11785 [Gammaproteobacteria bacterium]|nr:hypothetical protein [Gammaproteobacteria bacterium]
MMMKFGITGLLLTALTVSGCGGTPERSCDEVELYQLASEGRRIEPPEGLDELDELKEIPLPEASPRPPRAEGSPCLDLPPVILGES